MKMVINSDHSMTQAISEIKTLYAKKKYVRINITAGRDRSLEQNRLFHDWIQQLTVQGGEFTFDGYRNFCRLHFFVPVLISENDQFASLWWSLFDKEKSRAKDSIQYCTQMQFVATIEGISSICTTAQFSMALQEMQKHYSTLENDPVFLEFPDEMEAVK